jgi:hypothetical protein
MVIHEPLQPQLHLMLRLARLGRITLEKLSRRALDLGFTLIRLEVLGSEAATRSTSLSAPSCPTIQIIALAVSAGIASL